MTTLLQRIDRRTIIAITIIAGFFVVLFVLIFHGFAEAIKDVLLVMLGALVAMTKDVVNYDFSSTASSAGKDETIKAAALARLPSEEKAP